jgi:hypothetical protein
MNQEKINKMKSRAKLIEVKLTAISYDMSLIYEELEGDQFFNDNTQETLDDLNGSINAGLQEIDSLRNLLIWEGRKVGLDGLLNVKVPEELKE